MRARERVSLGAVPWTMNYGGQNQNSLAAERFLTNCLATQRILLLFPTILIYKQILGVARDQISTDALIYSTYSVYETDLKGTVA